MTIKIIYCHFFLVIVSLFSTWNSTFFSFFFVCISKLDRAHPDWFCQHGSRMPLCCVWFRRRETRVFAPSERVFSSGIVLLGDGLGLHTGSRWEHFWSVHSVLKLRSSVHVLWFSHRVCVVTPETGFGSADRSGRLLTALCVRLTDHSQNALRRRYGGRSGLLSGIHMH